MRNKLGAAFHNEFVIKHSRENIWTRSAMVSSLVQQKNTHVCCNNVYLFNFLLFKLQILQIYAVQDNKFDHDISYLCIRLCSCL